MRVKHLLNELLQKINARNLINLLFQTLTSV